MEIKKPPIVGVAKGHPQHSRLGLAGKRDSEKSLKCSPRTLAEHKAILDQSAEEYSRNVEVGYLFLHDALQRARFDLFRVGETKDIIDFLEYLTGTENERFPFKQNLDWQIIKDVISDAVILIKADNKKAADLKLRMVTEGIARTLQEMAEDRTQEVGR